jgi:serine/threonine protein phosphatase PrpC
MLQLPGGLALAVADGVSTSCHARAAADLACAEALATLRDFASVDAADRLALAVKRAHAAICKLPYDAVHMAEPQATIVLALIEGQQLWYACVGDSRLYVLGAGEATQLTVDDSWLNAQLADGVAPQDAEKDENAHSITQCLGMRDEEPHVHVGSHALTADMSVLLCSDGLWNYLATPAALATLLAPRHPSATFSQRCAHLVDFANAAGGHDNITVALFALHVQHAMDQ